MRGRNSYETCGAKSIMTAVFSELDCEVTEYFDFEENPKIEDLERGLLLLRKYSCSVIVAVGGGSVLDMAKLLRFFILILVSLQVVNLKKRKICFH